tara:strand:- start:239 stop:820 length:582 start_codon:yes stop_codon:yes gene_type:complete
MGRNIGRNKLYSLNKLGQTNTNTVGDGLKGAVTSTVTRKGHRIYTEFVVDLAPTGVSIKSKDTAGDIIGIDGTAGAYLGQLTPAVNGYITNVEMICLELPTTGDDDIMLYAATEANGAYDGAIGDLAETLLIDPAGAWALGKIDHYAATKGSAHDLGLEDKYIYLVGNGDTAGTYDAGKFIITFEGYAVPDDK